jgi:hypothetical protein
MTSAADEHELSAWLCIWLDEGTIKDGGTCAGTVRDGVGVGGDTLVSSASERKTIDEHDDADLVDTVSSSWLCAAELNADTVRDVASDEHGDDMEERRSSSVGQ